jgi:hypothetical protein
MEHTTEIIPTILVRDFDDDCGLKDEGNESYPIPTLLWNERIFSLYEYPPNPPRFLILVAR